MLIVKDFLLNLTRIEAEGKLFKLLNVFIDMSERLLSRWMNYKHNHSQIQNSRSRDED
jgi:hypothetical protein